MVYVILRACGGSVQCPFGALFLFDVGIAAFVQMFVGGWVRVTMQPCRNGRIRECLL